MAPLTADEIGVWLQENHPRRLRDLFDAANRMRQEVHGDDVHLRGLLHLGNRCRRMCHYCCLRQPNHRVRRYQLQPKEILRAVGLARMLRCQTIVIQGGEADPSDLVALPEILTTIADRYMPAITLSLGEQPQGMLLRWYDAGARRYLLKFETSNRALYHRLHPPLDEHEPTRIEILTSLRRVGYEIGSGMIVGLPGQTWDSVAHDLLLCRSLDLDMIAVGPWIPHPDTPLGRAHPQGPPAVADQVPNSPAVALKALALARLLCPEANIPATTALSLAAGDCTAALTSGANVLMLDVTPASVRAHYSLYPGPVLDGPSVPWASAMRSLRQLGRPPSLTPGNRPRSTPPPYDAATPAAKTEMPTRMSRYPRLPDHGSRDSGRPAGPLLEK